MRPSVLPVTLVLALCTSIASAGCLDEVAAFAEKICGQIQTSGSSKLTEANGQLKVEVSGIVRKVLGDAGGSINVKQLGDAYENVLRKDLSTELFNVRDCRIKMVEVGKAEACKPVNNQSRVGACATGASPSNAFRQEPASNGSWDWNCNGKVERQYGACENLSPEQCKPNTNVTGASPGFCSAYRAPDGCKARVAQCGASGYIYPCFFNAASIAAR